MGPNVSQRAVHRITLEWIFWKPLYLNEANKDDNIDPVILRLTFIVKNIQRKEKTTFKMAFVISNGVPKNAQTNKTVMEPTQTLSIRS